MITAACRVAPPAAAVDPAFLPLFAGQAASLVVRLVDALCGVMHSHVPSGKLPASLGVALVVSTLRALHTPLVLPRVPLAAWTKLFGALHRVQAVVGAALGEQLLREAVLAVEQCAVPAGEQVKFFNEVLRPAFHAILQPKATGGATSADSSSSSSIAASQSSSSSSSFADETDESGFDCFWRFSLSAPECWIPLLKDLIPEAVRPRLFGYCNGRKKQTKQPSQIGFNGRPERVQRFGSDAPTIPTALTADELRAESARLKLQSALETEELKTHPANSDMQERINVIKQQQAPVMLAAWSVANYMHVANDA